MAALPAGLGFLDPVLLPRTAAPGAAFHRPSDRPTLTGCGQNLAELTRVETDVALGMGCQPCPACWPPLADAIYPGGPRLRPAAPWPSNGAGYRSRLGRTYEDVRPPRPAIPAA